MESLGICRTTQPMRNTLDKLSVPGAFDGIDRGGGVKAASGRVRFYGSIDA
jgi:hypothetical protein